MLDSPLNENQPSRKKHDPFHTLRPVVPALDKCETWWGSVSRGFLGIPGGWGADHHWCAIQRKHAFCNVYKCSMIKNMYQRYIGLRLIEVLNEFPYFGN